MFLFIGLIFLFLFSSFMIYLFFAESEEKISFIITLIGLALIFWWIFSFSYGDTAAEYGCRNQLGSYLYLNDSCVDDNKIKMEDDYNFLLKFLSGIGWFLIIGYIFTMIKMKYFPDEDDD